MCFGKKGFPIVDKKKSKVVKLKKKEEFLMPLKKPFIPKNQ